MRHFTLFCLTFLGLILTAFTEKPIKISITDILESAQKERRFVMNNQTLGQLNTLNYRLPFVKDIGLRYGTDDLTNTQGQYAASFSFNTFKLIREQEKIKTAQINLYQAKKDMLLAQILADRYTNITDAYFAQLLLNSQNQLDTLLNQKNTVLKTSLQKGIPIKVKDLVETEDDIRSLRFSMAEMGNIKSLSYQHIKEYLNIEGDFVLSFNDFITIGKLEQVVNNIKVNKNIQTPELRYNQSRMALSEAELRVEEASFKQIFDNIQFIYRNDQKSDLLLNDVSFRLGFNIPIKGNLRPKKNELLLDIKEAENDYQFAYFQMNKELKLQILQLENLIKQYKISQNTLNTSISNNILNTPSVLATLSAADIIDLKIIQQKKTVELHKIYYDIIKEYVKLLTINSDFVFAPQKNFLSNTI